MRSRNVLTGILLGAGSIAGTLLFRRRLARRRERVDVYFGDGSMVSLAKPGEAEQLLRHARRILELAG
jgi:TctA family transporter